MATDVPAEVKELGFEPTDVSTRGFLYFLLITGILLVITCLVMIGLFSRYRKTDVPIPTVAQPFHDFRVLTPPPRIQTAPANDIIEYRQAQERLLNSWGWIDQKQGIARIPINRAMQLLLRQGLPTEDQTNAAPPANAEAATDQGRATKASPQKRFANATPK